MKFEQNFDRQGMEKGLEWWTCSTPFFSMHVYSRGDGWKYKINSLTSWESKKTYTARVIAQKACAMSVREKLLPIAKEFESMIPVGEQ